MKIPAWALAACWMGGWAAAAQAAAPPYRIDAFAPAPEGSVYQLGAMNEAGVVAGTLVDLATQREEAFFWRGGVFHRLGVLDGVGSVAADLNDQGVVVGNVRHADRSSSAFIHEGGRTRPIPLPDGAGGNAVALAINNAGHVLGYTGGITSPSRPFIYDGRESQYLDLGGAYFGHFTALNDRDEILGTVWSGPDADPQLAIYRGGRVEWLPPVPDEPPLRDLTAYATTGLNHAGQALVTVNGTIDGHAEDEIYGFIYSNGQYTRFGPNFFFTSALNGRGWAVGSQSSDQMDPPPDRIGLYRDGDFAYLDALARPADAAWTLEQAYALSDRGVILGHGNLGGFIATPIPEPGVALLMLAGLGLLGAASRPRAGGTRAMPPAWPVSSGGAA